MHGVLFPGPEAGGFVLVNRALKRTACFLLIRCNSVFSAEVLRYSVTVMVHATGSVAATLDTTQLPPVRLCIRLTGNSGFFLPAWKKIDPITDIRMFSCYHGILLGLPGPEAGAGLLCVLGWMVCV